MKIGTAEPVIEPRKPRRKSSRLRGGGPNRPSGGNGGGGGSGGSGGGDNWGDRHPHSESVVGDKAKIVTWFLLLVVLMTFSGLIGAYIVLATNESAEWKPFALPIQVWISTGLILVSSISYHFGKLAVDENNGPKARKWLVATTVLGAAFIASQILAWMALVGQGAYLAGDPYAGFFYLLTAVHGVHVIGGIGALGAVLLRAWHDTENDAELLYRHRLTRSVGWYWHFMGVLWIVLFVLLGFWK